MNFVYKHSKSITNKIKTNNLVPTNFGFYNDKNQFRRIYLDINDNVYFYKEDKLYKRVRNMPEIKNEYLLFENYDNLMYILFNL